MPYIYIYILLSIYVFYNTYKKNSIYDMNYDFTMSTSRLDLI